MKNLLNVILWKLSRCAVWYGYIQSHLVTMFLGVLVLLDASINGRRLVYHPEHGFMPERVYFERYSHTAETISTPHFYAKAQQ
jgi:hypothetical protein